MANVWYDITKTLIGTAGLDLDSLSDPKMVAVNSGYVFSQAHNFLDDIAGGNRVATVSLANVTFGVTNEAFLDADDVTFVTPPVDTVTAFVIYNDSGVESTSPLIVFIDTGVVLPITTETARDLEIEFSANGVAKL